MSDPKQRKGDPERRFRIVEGGPWSTAWRVPAVLGGVGGLVAMFGHASDPHRFAFSWLFAFMTFLAIGLGSLFLILGLHLTSAGWGVTVRRTSEFFASALPVFLVLFIPIALSLNELYPWVQESIEANRAEEAEEATALLDSSSRALAQDHDHHGQVAEDEEASPEHTIHESVIQSKLAWLNVPFFLLRAFFYLIVWSALGLFFFGMSTRQDKEKGLALTRRMQGAAPLATILFGLTLTFAAFDWMMSLEPAWFSTIFGVQYYAVSVVAALATTVLVTMAMRGAGLMGDSINVEHYHDLGKLQFGFLVFWAYISFSQFMLIWYAGIPEEATYYHLRWWGGGGFQLMSLALVFLHFIVPFFLLISRNTKRRLPVLGFAAIWLLVMHVVEVFWLIMPYANLREAHDGPAQTTQVFGSEVTSLHIHWLDVACFLAVGGVYLSVVLWQMRRYPLIPIGDPRLQRALNFENA